jgi:hypothetical protein
VQAIVKIRDQEWKPAEDWTSLKEKFFCRDKPAEDVEELVIVISNSKFNDRTHVLTDINSTGGSPTELKISALGCSPWIGTASNSGFIDPFFGVSYTAQVTWSLDEIVDNVSIYKPSGAVTADFNGICTFSPKISDIDPATSGSLAIDYNTSPPTYRGSGGTGWLTTLTCPGPDGFSIPSAVTVMYFGGSAGEEFRARQAVGEVSPDGITIEGSGMEAGRTINWKFTRVR